MHGMPPVTPASHMMSFVAIKTFTNSGGGPSITKRFISNSIWRPEATSGVAAAPFLEWQGIYSFYRVLGFEYEISVSNNEAFPVDMSITNTSEDPSASAAVTDAIINPTQIFQLAAKGGIDTKRVVKYYNVWDVIRNKRVVMESDSYRGTMTAGSETNPADVTWLGVSATSATGANLTNGVTCIMKIMYKTVLTGPQIMTEGNQPLMRIIDGVEVPKGGKAPTLEYLMMREKEEKRLADIGKVNVQSCDEIEVNERSKRLDELLVNLQVVAAAAMEGKLSCYHKQ